MSSDGSRTTSSSSRLSQFGLYRSIDARTEEFLRLSRKRQIRQGCACAAVSTAITVTVVITVILVYEYTVDTESNVNQKNRKPTWHGLFNDSSAFEAKFNKAKFNLDPVTVKLLPILFKAFNLNKYLEKNNEDSNSSTNNIKNEATESTFKHNIYPASIYNKQRGNPSKYYKTPVVGYKNPFNNLDYFRKIRQTKDYQRMLKYFDKMINGNNHDSPQPFSDEIIDVSKKPLIKMTTAKNEFHRQTTPKNQISHLPLLFEKTTQSLFIRPSVDYSKLTREKTSKGISKTTICKYTEKVVQLLRKLVTNIQELIPEISPDKVPCTNNDKTIATKTPITPITTRENSISADITTPRPLVSSILQSKLLNSIKNYIIKEEDLKNSLESMEFNFVKPNYTDYLALIQTTTLKACVKPTEAHIENQSNSTIPMTNRNNGKHLKLSKLLKLNKENFNSQTTTTYNYKTLDHKTLKKSLTADSSAFASGKSDEFLNFQFSIKKPGVELKRNGKNITEKYITSYPYLSLEVIKKIPFRKSGNLVNNYNANNSAQKSNSTSILLFKSKNNNWDNLIQTKRDKVMAFNKEHEETYSWSDVEIPLKSTMKPKYENKSVNLFESVKKNAKTHTPPLDDYVSLRKLDKYIKTKNYQKDDSHRVLSVKKLNTTAIENTDWLEINNFYEELFTVKFEKNIDSTTSKIIIKNTATNSIAQKVSDLHNKNSTNFKVNLKAKKLLTIPTPAKKSIDDKLYFKTLDFLSDFDKIYNRAMINKTMYITSADKHQVKDNQTDEKSSNLILDYDEFRFVNEDIQERDTPEENNFTPSLLLNKYDGHENIISKEKYTETTFIKSMLPISRPTYLEIHRNDWKHDNHDYENMDNTFI